jgi:hypothetical protein
MVVMSVLPLESNFDFASPGAPQNRTAKFDAPAHAANYSAGTLMSLPPWS